MLHKYFVCLFIVCIFEETKRGFIMKTKFNHKTESENFINGGVQYLFKFENGYGASVVKHSFSYGSASGLWELAILDSDDSICYTTEITDDVIGWLSEDQVEKLLVKISNL